MNTPINIHPDFQKVRGMELSFNPLLLGLMNGLMGFAASRKWAKYKSIVTAHTVIGLDGHRIPVWLIKPATAKAPAPVLVYCHGGAWILKHSPQHIENAIRYAQEANCCVLFVDYRLAPKHAFPKPFDDCYAALVWAQQNAEKLGIDKQRIAVGGDSAGAAIAAGAAQKARDEGMQLCGQLLLYPVTDSDCKTPSGAAYANVAPFKNFSRKGMWEAYLGQSLDAGVPKYASPIHGNLSGLAPAYVETGEYDPLCDEGMDYAKALSAQGIAVALNETKGTIHGFDALVPNAKLSQDAIASRVQYLRKIFNT
ncbi:MAG TPA: alpha/beta hydrolase [Spongiibacteraceae bacterium]|nr:alpha/beta hydrolase [Spongiibacteraceae bacterium]